MDLERVKATLDGDVPVRDASSLPRYIGPAQYIGMGAHVTGNMVLATDRLQSCVGILVKDDGGRATLAHLDIPGIQDPPTLPLTDFEDATAMLIVGGDPFPDLLTTAETMLDDAGVPIEEVLYTGDPGSIAYDPLDDARYRYRKPLQPTYALPVRPDGGTGFNGY